MGNELAIGWTEGRDLAQHLTKSSLVPEALRGKEADILFIVLTGSEMGMGPMKSLQAFESIKGRVGMKPVYMLGMVRAHPSVEYIDMETTPTSATVTSKRKASAKVLKTTFTMEQAKTAGLTSSEMYRKWPGQMLGWRAVAIHCRENYSDIIGGHYTTEEVETFERDVTPVSSAPVDATPTVEAIKKRRMAIIETPTPVPTPPPASLPSASEPVIDWGKSQGKALSTFSLVQLDMLVKKATEEAAKGGDDASVWALRLADYTAEVQRRAPQAEVAP